MYDREPFVPATTGLSLKDFAFHRMRDAIRNCEFEPGKFVSENEFSETLGLGKAAVRDALAKLATASLVISHGRSGWQVAPISGQRIGEVIELRRRLEPCLAGIDYDEADLDKLSGLAGLRNLQDAVQDNRQALDTLVHYDRSFMETLAGLSGRDLPRPLAERIVGSLNPDLRLPVAHRGAPDKAARSRQPGRCSS